MNQRAATCVRGRVAARSRAVVDGHKQLAWLATYVFLAKNGVELDARDDPAYELVVAVAAGQLDDVEAIARVLRSFAPD